MDIKKLLNDKINLAKKEKLTRELLRLNSVLKQKRKIIDNIKELYNIELTKEAIIFIGCQAMK